MGTIKYIFLAAYLLIFMFESLLKFLNLRHLRRYGNIVPQDFEGEIDEELLKKTRSYILEHSYFGYLESVFDLIVLIVFIFGGVLALYDSWIASFGLPFFLAGAAFFLLLSLASTILSLPFSLYSNFKIENKYGFNTMTYKLWAQDLIKSLIISVLLTTIISIMAFAIIVASPHFWWFWLWLFILGFGIFMMYVSPYVIEPLFHKFTPIAEEEMERNIRELMGKVKIKVSKVLVVDASKRSRHTNAYFTGIGRVKRIVLFDNLMKRMNQGEIIAILAHEAGHWKKKHVLKRMVVIELTSLLSLFISYWILQGDVLISLFGIGSGSFFVKLILLGFVGSILTFFVKPIGSFISRRHESLADRFACEAIDDRKYLVDALVKLSKDNLSNLHPHPLYAFFYYSHPPIQQRLRKIVSFP